MIYGLSSLGITAIVLVLGVVYVNGVTDAPNAISTCISTRCLTVGKAVVLSSVFNLVGVVAGGCFASRVTDTVMNMVRFGNDEYICTVCLCGGMVSVVLWAAVAWYFGIPTSESHALVAGLSGSAVSVSGSLSGINADQWMKAVYGLVFSCVLGLAGGYIICRMIISVFRNVKRSKSNSFFRCGQIFAASAMSFMHGAQDGQKFIAVLLLCLPSESTGNSTHRLCAVIICSVIMAAGTLSGGKKIIKTIGMDMVRLEKYQGFSADLAGSFSLLLSTLNGFPVSTTHAKTMAMVGSALGRGRNRINPSVVKDMVMAWIFTFPGCGLLSLIVTKIFLKIF